VREGLVDADTALPFERASSQESSSFRGWYITHFEVSRPTEQVLRVGSTAYVFVVLHASMSGRYDNRLSKTLTNCLKRRKCGYVNSISAAATLTTELSTVEVPT